MSKKWIATCTDDDCATTYDVEVEAEDYSKAYIEAACKLKVSYRSCYVVDLVEKSEN